MLVSSNISVSAMRRAGHGTASAPVISRMASMKSASEISKPPPAPPSVPSAAASAAAPPGLSSSPGWQAPAANASPCAGAGSACVGASCCGGCCGGCACCWSPVRECQCRSATPTRQTVCDTHRLDGAPNHKRGNACQLQKTQGAGEARLMRAKATHEHRPYRRVPGLLRQSPRRHPAQGPGRACGSAPLPSCASPVLP